MATQSNETARKRKLISVKNYLNFVHKCYSRSITAKYKLVQLPNNQFVPLSSFEKRSHIFFRDQYGT